MDDRRYFIIHYQEIALKGKNRYIFVRKLIENIKYITEGLGIKHVREKDGRIILDLMPEETPMSQRFTKENENPICHPDPELNSGDSGSPGKEILKQAMKQVQAKVQNDREAGFSDERVSQIAERLSMVFGIANFSLAHKVSSDVEILKREIHHYIKDKEFTSFRISTKRAYKAYPLTSMDVDRIVGAHIKESTGAKVNLTGPGLTVFIEILSGDAYFYTEKLPGLNGLPVGTSGKVVCLLSGGIDSPVAAYRVMRRGCSVVFVHFHSYPYLSKASQEKVQDISEILNQYQHPSKLYLISFGDVQKEIVLSVPAKYRVVLYRRMMLRIAERIAGEVGALVLVTGESIGQVASQTLKNIATIEDAAGLPVIRPLIGMDKGEIMDQAKKLGTYDISIIPDQDCCQLFIPKNPAVRTTIREIERVEKRLDIEKLLKMAFDNIKCL